MHKCNAQAAPFGLNSLDVFEMSFTFRAYRCNGSAMAGVGSRKTGIGEGRDRREAKNSSNLQTTIRY